MTEAPKIALNRLIVITPEQGRFRAKQQGLTDTENPAARLLARASV